MERHAIGVMSGTSCDGISAARVAFAAGQVRTLAHATVRYDAAMRRRLLAAPQATAAELCGLNVVLSRWFARAVRRVWGRGVEAIGSHGHTVWHERGATLQIGDPSLLALEFRVPVVSDFRAADVAAGGTGAPLVPRFDLDFLARPGRALLNLGGIANVTLPDGRAFDTGPGNMLLDEAARRMGVPCDRDGQLARRGRVDLRLWRRLMAHPFLARRPPKSTGREEFGATWYDRAIGRTGTDVLATLAFFTATAIAAALRPCRLREVIVSGGGVHNRTLMDHLRRELWPAAVRSITELGIPAQAKEPAAFAWLALLRLEGRPGNVPRATGARRPVVLGKITHGS